MPCLRLRLRTPVSACVSRLRLRVPSSECSPLAALTAIKAIATSTEPERVVYWRLYKIIKRFAYAWAHDCILVSLSLSLSPSLSLSLTHTNIHTHPPTHTYIYPYTHMHTY